jgi:hypothetical protein
VNMTNVVFCVISSGPDGIGCDEVSSSVK